MEIDLKVIEGPHRGKRFKFAEHDNFVVGRGKHAHFRLSEKDPYFSRVHFVVEVNPPHCYLLDMGSRNGTWVNGKRVPGAYLSDGDQIKAGRTVLKLSVSKPAEETLVDSVGEEQERAITGPPPLPRGQGGGRNRRGNVLSDSVRAVGEAPLTPAPPIEAVQLDQPTTNGPVRRVRPPAPQEEPARPPTPSPKADASRHRSRDRLAVTENFHPGVDRRPKSPGRAPLGPTADEHAAPAESDGDTAPDIPGYQIVRVLGRGGMGVVYLAMRSADGKQVALKTIRSAVSAGDREVKRFLREVEILRELWHPNIVRFHEVGKRDDLLYFVMDYVPGTDAERLLNRCGPLSVRLAVGLMCQVLYALHYAHSRGFVHRDVKPANVLVSKKEGRAVTKLADFGLARAYQASAMSGITMLGEAGGTPAFMPPEQITNYRDVSAAADQYSAAATLYRLLAGCQLFDFEGAPTRQRLRKILFDEPVPIRQRQPDIPEALADAIHRALKKDPADRYPEVAAFHNALLPFAGG